MNKKGKVFAIFIVKFPDLKKKLKLHKSNQHNSVMKESEKLKKEGLSRFAKKKFK